MTSVRVELDEGNTASLDTLKALSFQVAGAVSAVFMAKHPQEVLPTQEVAAAVYTVLADFDFKAGTP